MRTSIRRAAAGLAVVLGCGLLAACGGYDDTVVPEPKAAADPDGGNATEECVNDGTSELRSYDPDSGSTDGAAVAKIRDRGRLVAGIAADTKLLGSRDAATGNIVGFDIDFAAAVAEAIFGEPGHLELKVITAADRIPELQNGGVDIVARNMTINCARWKQIAFSAEYYRAGQKVLVGKDAGIENIEDLADKRICAPEGTTSIQNIQKIQPDAIPVTSGDNSECMVLFQAGEADGVSTDDVVLAGLAAQDPYSIVLDTEFLTQEPYGIGVNSDNVDLVRLINQTLEDMRADGRWQEIYDRWLKAYLGKGQAPKPVYGR